MGGRICRLADEGGELMLKELDMKSAVDRAWNGDNIYLLIKLDDQTTVRDLACAGGFCSRTEEEKATRSNVKRIDHGRIVALDTAEPPRSPQWIADDLGISAQTVINHLKKEGIYKDKEASE